MPEVVCPKRLPRKRTGIWIGAAQECHGLVESQVGVGGALDGPQPADVLLDGAVVPVAAVVELEMDEGAAGIGDQRQPQRDAISVGGRLT